MVVGAEWGQDGATVVRTMPGGSAPPAPATHPHLQLLHPRRAAQRRARQPLHQVQEGLAVAGGLWCKQTGWVETRE